MRKFRGTCCSHAPLISSFRPKLQQRSRARRLSNAIESQRNVHRAIGKTNDVFLYILKKKIRVKRSCHVACVVSKILRPKLWRLMFCSVCIMYTADVKYFNGLFYVWCHYEIFLRRPCFTEKNMKRTYVVNSRATWD